MYHLEKWQSTDNNWNTLSSEGAYLREYTTKKEKS